MMKIGVLTSSRADYSIYLPLLNELKKDPFFELHILAFGTHLSQKHGYTLKAIEEDGFSVSGKFITYPDNDSPLAIANSMAKTIQLFAEFWEHNRFDLVFCFGDRFEMFAACAASLPFSIQLAHLHGGETTLGAIDNVYRHSITQMCKLHLASSEQYKTRILELLDEKKGVYFTGALSYDSINSLHLFSTEEFKQKFGLDLTKPTILITFHPETILVRRNEFFMDELISALMQLEKYQFLITMPNADTRSELIRTKWTNFIANNSDRAFGFENLGTIGYYSAMKLCSFLLGNSSSGCIEAAYFPKWVINIGARQNGRISTTNMVHCEIEKKAILAAIEKITNKNPSAKSALYGNGTAAKQIVSLLKNSKRD